VAYNGHLYSITLEWFWGFRTNNLTFVQYKLQLVPYSAKKYSCQITVASAIKISWLLLSCSLRSYYGVHFLLKIVFYYEGISKSDVDWLHCSILKLNLHGLGFLTTWQAGNHGSWWRYETCRHSGFQVVGGFQSFLSFDLHQFLVILSIRKEVSVSNQYTSVNTSQRQIHW